MDEPTILQIKQMSTVLGIDTLAKYTERNAELSKIIREGQYTVQSDCLLKSNRTVIPKRLQKEVAR